MTNLFSERACVRGDTREWMGDEGEAAAVVATAISVHYRLQFGCE